MKEYKDMKTIDELLQSVKMHGLKTDSESICAAQDILAYTDQGVLDEIMGGNYRGTLLHVMFRVLDCDMATRFYNRHNGVNKKIDELEAQLKEANELNCKCNKELEESRNYTRHLTEQKEFWEQNHWKMVEKVKENEAKDIEIMKLKAKLYDLMMKEGE